MRWIMLLLISIVSLIIITGCVSTPEKSFYDSKVLQIEVNTINYERNKNKDEFDKFEQDVVGKLMSKGYQAYVGQRIINDQLTAWGAAEKLVANSTAGAFMIIDSYGIEKAELYRNGKHIGKTLWALNMIYWMYNRNGERILQASDKFIWRDSAVVRRKGERVYFKPGSVLNDIASFVFLDLDAGTYKILETEEEFMSRVAEEFTSNIPSVSKPDISQSITMPPPSSLEVGKPTDTTATVDP
jgi:hypothetical protein